MSDTMTDTVIPFGYELDEEHLMLRDSIRDFARNVVAPGAMERDLKG